MDPGVLHLKAGKRTLLFLRRQRRAGFLVDLTGITRPLERLALKLRTIEEGIDSLPEAFVLYDDQDRLIICNSQYAELYPTIAPHLRPGITFGEITRLAVNGGQFLLDADAADWINRRLDFHRRGEGYFEQHLNDGRWIQLSERRTSSGGTTSIRTDITLLKEREAALRQAMLLAESTSQSMARFLAVFSHEVRNGLNAVAGIAQMLAHDAQTPEQRQRAELMLRSTGRVTTVLGDLLDYLKHEATGVSVSLRAMQPRRVLENVLAEFAPQARARGLSLSLEISGNVPERVHGDPDRIHQVLTNLVSNALKYSDHGTVTLGLARAGDRLRYSVSDQGIGIAPENIDGLFEYFTSATPGSSSSTGLGLAISKQLVQAMQGEISVWSEAGKGSRFWFEVPLRALPRIRTRRPARSPRAEPEASTRTGRSLRVGVVDDDPVNTTVAEALLRQIGHAPVVLSDGDQLIEHVRRRGLDVVLLDLMMPVESGFDIAARLRAERSSGEAGPAIVALTGNVVPDSLAACRAAGFDAILQKPLFLEQLQHALDAIIDRDAGPPAIGPIVFGARSGVVQATADAAAPEQVDAVLERLRADIGEARLHRTLLSARETIEAIRDHHRLDDPSRLALLHRLTGSAPQLGFVALGEAANEVHLLITGLAAGVDDAALEPAWERLDLCARSALAILERRLGRRAGAADSS